MTSATAFDDPQRRGLFVNAAAFVVVCLVVNGVIFGLGWNAPPSSAGRAPFIPPGPVVGTVWTLLFALMGAARWAYVRDARDRGWRGWMPVVLAAVCLAFPFYTSGLSDQDTGFIGTVATLGFAVFVAAALSGQSAAAAWAIVPTIVWTGWVAGVGAIFGRI